MHCRAVCIYPFVPCYSYSAYISSNRLMSLLINDTLCALSCCRAKISYLFLLPVKNAFYMIKGGGVTVHHIRHFHKHESLDRCYKVKKRSLLRSTYFCWVMQTRVPGHILYSTLHKLLKHLCIIV